MEDSGKTVARQWQANGKNMAMHDKTMTRLREDMAGQWQDCGKRIIARLARFIIMARNVRTVDGETFSRMRQDCAKTMSDMARHGKTVANV